MNGSGLNRERLDALIRLMFQNIGGPGPPMERPPYYTPEPRRRRGTGYTPAPFEPPRVTSGGGLGVAPSSAGRPMAAPVPRGGGGGGGRGGGGGMVLRPPTMPPDVIQEPFKGVGYEEPTIPVRGMENVPAYPTVLAGAREPARPEDRRPGEALPTPFRPGEAAYYGIPPTIPPEIWATMGKYEKKIAMEEAAERKEKAEAIKTQVPIETERVKGAAALEAEKVKGVSALDVEKAKGVSAEAVERIKSQANTLAKEIELRGVQYKVDKEVMAKILTEGKVQGLDITTMTAEEARRIYERAIQLMGMGTPGTAPEGEP